jgi:predicted kinase
MPLLIVTGLPATGKTMLARQLAQRYGVALIGKDAIKEPLLDAFAPVDRNHARRLSDVSFAVLFSIARELMNAGAAAILEGNFRPGEHEAPLRAIAPSSSAQILCRAAEKDRRARLAARQYDTSRHRGHRDAEQIDGSFAGDRFLDIPGEQFVFESIGLGASAQPPLLEKIDRWWHASNQSTPRRI